MLGDADGEVVAGGELCELAIGVDEECGRVACVDVFDGACLGVEGDGDECDESAGVEGIAEVVVERFDEFDEGDLPSV